MMLQSGGLLSKRFVLIQRLGAGGSSEVWLAQDHERGEPVAVKIIPTGRNRNEAWLAALYGEYECLRRFNHEHIVSVEGLHHGRDHAWLAMEYLAGGDLSRLRGQAWHEILPMALPLAAALGHVHDTGIVHRDVKPANVLLTQEGSPQLTDFGISLALMAKPASAAGRGSPFSMSPQQRAGAPASVADDIYGYGALLFELLYGYPPFYPDGPFEYDSTAAPAMDQPSWCAGQFARHARGGTNGGIAKMAAGAALPGLAGLVPGSLQRLLDSMLAPLPGLRPASMRFIEQELEALLAAAPTPRSIDKAGTLITGDIKPPTTPPSVRIPRAQEPLRGEWQRAGGVPPGGATADASRRRALRICLAAVGILAGIVVFVALPRWAAERHPALVARPATMPASLPAGDAQAREPVDLAALARARQGAEEQRDGLRERLDELTAQAAAQWDESTYQHAVAELAMGDEAYEAREYLASTKHYRVLEQTIIAMEQRAGEVLARQLQQGTEALRQEMAATALAAFALALRIEPENIIARQGSKRAATLDEVMKLVSAAERLEGNEQAKAALALFHEALALDAQAPRAAAGVRRIESHLLAEAFAGAMARGYSALAAGDYATARNEFEAARKIRPEAPEIAPAARQVEQQQRTELITEKLEQARQLEQQEQWEHALAQYQAILKLDATIAAAVEGVARATPRAALDRQLELYLTQPERLFSRPVHAAAKTTMEQALAIENPGPMLARQIAILQQWLQRAEVRVTVVLRSDNATQVAIHRIGELGSFSHKSLQLLPGSYTVVGTRPGYRDVRRQITIRPEAAHEAVVIQCEDRI